MKCRQARISDWGDLVSLAWHHYSEVDRAFPKPDKIVILGSIIASIISRGHAIFVVERGGSILGYVAGTCANNIYCVEKWASCTMLFVKKEHRGGKTALLLFRRFLEWADSRGAAVLSASSISGIDAASTGKFLEHCGLEYAGPCYIGIRTGMIR